MDRIRVLYLITGTEIAGAENALLDLSSGLDHRRFDARILTLSGRGGLLKEAARRGLEARSLGMRSRIDLRRLGGLRRELRRRPPEILHTFLFHANIAGRLFTRGGTEPALVSGIRGEYRRRSYRTLERLTFRSSDRIISVSRAIRRLYLADGDGEDFWKVIPNGIEARGPVREEERAGARETLGLPPGSPLIVTAARLTPEKGLHHLIRAFPAFLAAHPKGRVWIAGEGPLRARLEELAARTGVAERIHFLGRREDVERILLAGDLFVLPSVTEGMPRSLLEAANAETPIVASGVGGIPEMVRDGESALLVPPGDGNALVRSLIRLAGDRSLRAALAAEAKRVLRERFSLGGMIGAHEDLYLRLAEERGFVRRDGPAEERPA